MIKTPFSDSLHAEKYRSDGESFREAMNRIAGGLKSDEQHYRSFREILMDLRFMPAGRIQAAVGAPKRVTPYNCFVSGTIEDSFTSGHDSIMARATEAAETMRMGGGIGYDFSTLRPRGDLIAKLGSKSSGPISFMGIFDAICGCVASSGHRRGAQMGVLRVDHPDIEEFVHAKQNESALRGFNISIGITDEFMEAVLTQSSFTLRFSGRRYKEIDAAALWEKIMRSTWDWAEPGVLFLDTINRLNNLRYCEQIVATNPCGEQPLPPHGACLLGSFNLSKYVREEYTDHQNARYFDWKQFAADIPVVVRAMDRVIDLASYPLCEQEFEAKDKRRMGLGITGLANALEAMGHPYGSPGFVSMQSTILNVLNREAYRASAELARERGAFPMFDAKLYLADGTFASTLDEETKGMIRKYGIRNSHLTSIAPTGTISLCADNVSSGIEPVFSYEYRRTIQTFDGPMEVDVVDYGVRKFGTRGKVASDVTVDEHLNVLLAAAKRVDSAVSKTCNVPPTMPWNDFKSIYTRAWEGGAKGCTTFNVGGKRFGILATNEDGAKEAMCKIDPETGRRDCE
jgi:ribonucleoside-diphosphate reductase alpha chain